MVQVTWVWLLFFSGYHSLKGWGTFPVPSSLVSSCPSCHRSVIWSLWSRSSPFPLIKSPVIICDSSPNKIIIITWVHVWWREYYADRRLSYLVVAIIFRRSEWDFLMYSREKEAMAHWELLISNFHFDLDHKLPIVREEERAGNHPHTPIVRSSFLWLFLSLILIGSQWWDLFPLGAKFTHRLRFMIYGRGGSSFSPSLSRSLRDDNCHLLFFISRVTIYN